LDSDGIGDFAHDATQGVYFANQMTLGDAANCRITGHLSDQVQVHRNQSAFQTQARAGSGRFASGVARTYYYDVIIDHNSLFAHLF
jgi:hypothetical protein